MKLILANNIEIEVSKVNETINERNVATLRIYVVNFDNDAEVLKKLFTDENCKTMIIVSSYEKINEDGTTTTVETRDVVEDYKFSMLSKSYDDRSINVTLIKEL